MVLSKHQSDVVEMMVSGWTLEAAAWNGRRVFCLRPPSGRWEDRMGVSKALAGQLLKLGILSEARFLDGKIFVYTLRHGVRFTRDGEQGRLISA